MLLLLVSLCSLTRQSKFKIVLQTHSVYCQVMQTEINIGVSGFREAFVERFRSWPSYDPFFSTFIFRFEIV